MDDDLRRYLSIMTVLLSLNVGFAATRLLADTASLNEFVLPILFAAVFATVAVVVVELVDV